MNASWIRGTLWDRVALRLQGEKPPGDAAFDVFGELRSARQILVLPNDRVGGLFMGAPVYRALRQFYPEAHIHLLVDEKKAEIARQIPFVDGVLTAALDRPMWAPSRKQLEQELRSRQFDLAICLGPDCSFRLAHLCLMSGARLRVGFQRQGMQPFNIEIVPGQTGAYEARQCSQMLRLLGLGGGSTPRWTLSKERAIQVRTRYLEEESGRVIGLDVSRGEGRGLSQRQLDDIVGRVIERGVRALIFFSLAERKLVNYLRETYSNRVILFEQGDLPSAAALVGGCRALVACNTDLLHLAISLQVPVVGLFDEDPGRWVASENPLVNAVQTRDLRAVNASQIALALDAVLGEGQNRSER